MVEKQIIEQEFNKLLNKEINSLSELMFWISECDNLDSKIWQDYAWRYIKQTTDTSDELAKESYREFIQNIYPEWIVFSDKIGRKLIECKYVEQLSSEYLNYVRWVKHAVKYFREDNVILASKEKEIEAQWAEITWSWTVIYKWEELTMKQAEEYLKSIDRNERKEIFELIESRRYSDKDRLDEIMSQLVQIRTKIANNCGFGSYTDYKFSSRYDYDKSEINTFHEAIRNVINPIMKSFFDDRKQKLWIIDIKPYDFEVPLISVSNNEWFSSTNDMIDKLCLLLRDMDPQFEDFIREMQNRNNLDLDTRSNKAPWWYNYPLSWSPYSFIFMNAMRDHYGRFTWAHEAWHGIHHYLTKDLPIWYFRDCPSEICEIASMAMELFTMDELSSIDLAEDQIKDGLYQKITHDIWFFPYMSKIDLFQQRMYDYPNHTIDERKDQRKELNELYSFSTRTFDSWVWSEEYEKYLDYYRQRQMHLFEVPFYYIEYGIAQLASLQLYNQFVQDRNNAIDNYKKILSAWYIYSIPDTMKLWDVKFDVSEDKLRELMIPLIDKYKKL